MNEEKFNQIFKTVCRAPFAVGSSIGRLYKGNSYREAEKIYNSTKQKLIEQKKEFEVPEEVYVSLWCTEKGKKAKQGTVSHIVVFEDHPLFTDWVEEKFPDIQHKFKE